MYKFLLSFISCLIFCLSPLCAQTNDFPHFNPNTIEVFQGEVVSIQKFNMVNRPVPVVQIILRTEKCEIPVEIGPQWYIEFQGFTIVPKDRLEITGSIITLNNREIMIAQKLKRGSLALQLRDEEGASLWNHWRH